jgi:UDP-GlcNAc:undecaprenyl-phosphate GlcNAc-1-phosphate transferase
VPLNWYGILLIVAAVSAWVLTFPIRHIAARVGYVAQPDERKIHQRVTPQAGGVAMFLAMLVTVAVAASIPALDSLFQGSSEPLGLVLGAAAIFVVGVIDDIRDMSAPAKMAGQVLAAMILYFLGVTWFQFKVPLAGFVVLGSDYTPLLTALWVIAITNAVNLIDGLDGLAGGHRLWGTGRLRAPSPGGRESSGRQHRAAGGGNDLRNLPGLSSPQFLPGQDLHG